MELEFKVWINTAKRIQPTIPEDSTDRLKVMEESLIKNSIKETFKLTALSHLIMEPETS